MRDESVIGQILTCPKCGSMVLVELPRSSPTTEPRPSPPPRSATESTSISSPATTHIVGHDAAALSTAAAPKRPRAPEPSEFADTVEDLALQVGFEDRESRLDAEFANLLLSDDDVTAVSSTVDSQTDLADTDGTSTSEQPLMPTDEWTSPSSVKWRNHVLIGAAAATGILLALGVFAWFRQNGDRPTAFVADSTANAGSGNSVAKDSPQVEQTAPPIVNEFIESTPTTDAASNDGAPTPQSDQATIPVDSTVTPPIADSAPASAATGSEVTDTEPGDAAASPASAPQPDLITPIEPAPSTGSLAETLREFSAILRTPEAPAESDATVAAAALPPADAATSTDLPAPEHEILAERPEPRIVDVEARLADRLAGIELDGQPLAKFLQLMSDFSTIPITLDSDSLPWSKLTPESPIKLTRQSATAAEVLTAGLEPHGLYFVVDGDQLLVTRRPKEPTGRRSVRLDVTDLIGGDSARLQKLGALITELVAPDSWSTRGGTGTVAFEGSTLLVEQQETVLLEVLAFCEKLRVARGLPTRSPYDAALFRLDSRTQRAAEKLRQPVSLTYIRPALLQRILDRLGEASDMHLLVDWKAVSEEGWNPAAETQFTVADRPLSEALQTLLAPLDLTYRVVDETTLQITTPSALQARLEVEFYRVEGLLAGSSPDDLLAAVRTAVGPERFSEHGGSGQVAIDVEGKCLLATLPQPQQVALEQWLTKQRTPSPELTPTAAR